MRRNLFFVLFLVFLAQAQAQTLQWSTGGITSQWGLNCSIIGNNYGEIMLQSYAGWLHYSDYSAPKTGDSSYVSLVMSVPGLNCDGNSAVGFIPELFLPSGASLNITASTPVKCFYSINGSASSQFSGTQIGIIGSGNLRVGPLCPDGKGGGTGTPFLVGSANGPNGGLALGTQYLNRTSMLEIQIPVRFAKPLNGTSDKLHFTTYGSTIYDSYNGGQFFGDGTALHEVPILIGYRPTFGNFQASSLAATSAHVAADLSSFYTAGTAYIDYGTTLSYGSSVTIGAVPNTGEIFNVFADLTGLSPGTTYSWRIRYVTALGTFNSTNQTFNTTAAASFALNISKNGTGSGTVTSNTGGINCGATCAANFTQNATVTLTATADSGSSFAGWSGGGCSGTGTCTLTMDAAKSVTATFNTTTATTFALNVTKAGTGGGTVTSTPGGINCGATCAANFSSGASVTLTATPSSGSSFAGWGGACSGTSSCVVSMSAAKSVTATFNTTPSFGTLNLQVTGLPSGNSATLNISGPSGFNLSKTILSGTGVGLSDVVTGQYTVSASSVTVGSTLYNPSPASQTVTVTTGSVTASVNYVAQPATTTSFALSANKAGSGGGTVSSSPAGINCGGTCSANFAQSTVVTLSATPDSSSTFAGWSGACSGNAACTLTMDAAKSVTATFNATAAAAPSLSAAQGSNAPQDRSVNKGSTDASVLAFSLSPGSEGSKLESLTLQASGSGNDASDITAVKVYADANNNGQVDTGETALASGTFSANDGSLTLNIPSSSAPTISAASQFLVTVDIANTLAARGRILQAGTVPASPWNWIMLMLPMLLLWVLRRRSWRVGLIGVLLLLSLVGCGGSTPAPTAITKTYQITLTDVVAKGATSNQTATLSGLPIAGATLTVQK